MESSLPFQLMEIAGNSAGALRMKTIKPRHIKVSAAVELGSTPRPHLGRTMWSHFGCGMWSYFWSVMWSQFWVPLWPHFWGPRWFPFLVSAVAPFGPPIPIGQAPFLVLAIAGQSWADAIEPQPRHVGGVKCDAILSAAQAGNFCAALH